MDNARLKNLWKKIRRYLPLVLVIIAVFILARHIDLEALKGFLEKHPVFGPLLCYLAYLVLGFSFVPPDALTLMVLGWKGPVAAFCLKVLGDTSLAMIEFYFGAGVGDLSDYEKKKSRLPFHLGQLPVDSPAFLILGRFLPWFGPKIVGIAAGVSHVPARTFFWTTLVANMLGAILTIIGGYGLLQLLHKVPGGAAASAIAIQSMLVSWLPIPVWK